MRFLAAVALFAGLVSQAVAQQCSGPLVVDDFSRASSRQNNLDQQASDDATMARSGVAGGSYFFQPRQGSYFYENLPCQALQTQGYNAVSFGLRSSSSQPSSFVFEAQSRANCADTAYTSQFLLFSNVTSAAQTFTIPFSALNTTNLNGITSLVLTTFSSTSSIWTLGPIRLECGAGS